MKTEKLNKKMRKTIKRNKRPNKTSKKNKMVRGSGSPFEYRRSTRGLEQIEIPVVILGKGNPSQSSYNNQTLEFNEIKNVVDTKIKTGYQIVCFPMPPDESHSIVVEVTELGVKIVDWGGEENRKQKIPKWYNYTTFIKYLEQKYKKVIYYPIDTDIDEIACERFYTNNGQGGCSEYVHNWINKHIVKEQNKAVIFI